MGLFKGKKIQFSNNSDYQIFRLLFKQQQKKKTTESIFHEGEKMKQNIPILSRFLKSGTPARQ